MGKNTAQIIMSTNNYHVLIVKYVGQTNTKPSKVKIISELFKQAISFSYNSDVGKTLEQAIKWLQDKGFAVIGTAEGKGHDYIISETFEPLK